MIHFRHRLPTTEEITTLKQYCLTQGDEPWNPSSFSDQVTDKFHQQVIDTENYNASSNNLPDASSDEVNQSNIKLSLCDPSNLFANNLKGKPAHLAFYTDTHQNANINYTVPANTDPHYSKALPSKIEWNDMNKSQSWVNFFALSLSNPTPIISFARNDGYLDKMPFCHLIQYCKSNPSTNSAKGQGVSANPTGLKYKFGIQIPKGIKDALI